MLWLIGSLALADECLCLEWEADWQWSDCATGEDCPCGCSDAVDTGTTGAVCSEAGLLDPPRTGAECVFVGSTCLEEDCCDELVADCPGEEPTACGCVGSGIGASAWAALLGALAVGRARRPQPT
jgi:hypothetical protein